jgi:hypothetical protein
MQGADNAAYMSSPGGHLATPDHVLLMVVRPCSRLLMVVRPCLSMSEIIMDVSSSDLRPTSHVLRLLTYLLAPFSSRPRGVRRQSPPSAGMSPIQVTCSAAEHLTILVYFHLHQHGRGLTPGAGGWLCGCLFFFFFWLCPYIPGLRSLQSQPNSAFDESTISHVHESRLCDRQVRTMTSHPKHPAGKAPNIEDVTHWL